MNDTKWVLQKYLVSACGVRDGLSGNMLASSQLNLVFINDFLILLHLLNMDTQLLFQVIFVSQSVDIGGELTDGCHGFATKYMHWNEDLIVGGITKNKTNHIVK